MNCQNFERSWNLRLDALGKPDDALEHALDAHAASCPECRALAARFLLLSQAIANLRPVAPPAGFADRCLEALHHSPAATGSPWLIRLRALALPLAAAACLLAAALLGLSAVGTRKAPQLANRVHPEPELLTDALADATSATWELALQASGPAARIGREVLDTAVEREPSATALMPAAPANMASGVLQSVGERVNEGVRPLSGSAKHAFGFLLGPALDESQDGPRPS